ncbi:hypothetical protein [Streptomyces sp. NPDC002676]
MLDPELLERITVRRAELDELEEQLSKQLAEIRAERGRPTCPSGGVEPVVISAAAHPSKLDTWKLRHEVPEESAPGGKLGISI